MVVEREMECDGKWKDGRQMVRGLVRLDECGLRNERGSKKWLRNDYRL